LFERLLRRPGGQVEAFDVAGRAQRERGGNQGQRE
jgi:hypothetical protein